jgi:phospholipid transport system substrate-binding protein
MKRRQWGLLALTSLALSLSWVSPAARAADEAPDVLIKRITNDVLDAIRSDKGLQSGDGSKINALLDNKIMPYVNFQRMTASAVGPGWRQATPEQQKRLLQEFRILLTHTYSGALSQVSDQQVVIKPMRGNADDAEVVVRTEVRGRGDPIQLDYRLEKTSGEGAGWKIYNMNVLGIWMVDAYRNQFAAEVNANGIEGLIGKLVERNKSTGRKG